ncbi:MAG: cellulase family glycosylhydrolase, partial [Lacisediminihabitans sp.]
MSLFSVLALATASLVTVAVAGPSVSQAHASTVNGFVTRSGTTLQLNGSPFRFAGANMYWLGLDENVGGVAYPTQYRVNDALATAREMGATVVRSHTLGTSVGCTLCIEPTLGTFNETALEKVDYAIKTAGENGIRLILPLVDNWHYYSGGKHTFTDWRGLTNEDDFYTNTTVIADFEQYISTILNHVNVYTGVANKDNPAILAWEEGNELTNAPATWVSTIATYIKSIDANHLVAYGTISGTIDTGTLSVSNLDIEDAHYYPMSVSQVNSQAAQVESAGKVFYVGEFGWNGAGGGDSLASFLSAVEGDGAAGDTYWSFFPHGDVSGYVQHADGYTLHYPGDTPSMRTSVDQLRSHAYTMQGITPPTPATPGSALVTSVVGNQVNWRGATLADTYDGERSTTSATTGYSVVCAQCVTDNTTPWTDSTQPSGFSWYRVRGYNVANSAGPYSSNVYEVLSDPLNDWSHTYSHSAN